MIVGSRCDSEASDHVRMYREVLSPLTQHWDLTWELAKREVSDRYAGQGLVAIWVFIHPLLVMGIYVFIFSFVFKGSLGPSDGLAPDYTLYILSGLIAWVSLQESMGKACGAIVTNAPLLKQVAFPVELLPAKSVLTSMLNLLIAICILVLYTIINQWRIPWTYTLIPVLLMFQLLMMMGVGYLLSSVCVYVRDLKDVVQAFGVIGVYLVPVLYPPQWVPNLARPLLYLNPLSYLIWCYQDVFSFGRLEHWWAWCIWPVFSIAIFAIGFRTFTTLKTMFGNVL